jgi:filamentous hemagglutinin
LTSNETAQGTINAYRSLAQQAEGRITVLERGGIPLGFSSRNDFESFGQTARDSLAAAGHADAEVYLRGSAVTGYKYSTGEAFDIGRRSDYDVSIVSPRLMQRAEEIGVKLRGGRTRTGPLDDVQVRILGLGDAVAKLRVRTQRDIGIVIFRSINDLTKRGPNIPIE